MTDRAHQPNRVNRTFSVRVARARPSDVGAPVARLSGAMLRDLALSSGDVIEVTGKRRTAAIAMLLPLEDRGLDVIRLNGLLRVNAGASIGDFVTVTSSSPAAARRVRLSVPKDLEPLRRDSWVMQRLLEGRVLCAGDLISPRLARERGEPSVDPSPPEAASVAEEPYPSLSHALLHVLSTEPGGLVRVTSTTTVDVVVDPADERAPSRPSSTYDDLGGLGDAVRQVREIVELPLTHPELFQQLGITPPRGVLIHGPPGTGKTLLARAVAGEASAHFLHVAGPEFIGPHLGESERRLREVFHDARARAPSIIFIDEIDSIAGKRGPWGGETERRIVAQLLMLMDGLEPRGNVIVLAATNAPDMVDEALRRPGRFEREIAVGAPNEAGRREILRIHTRGMPLAPDVALDGLARETFGFVGADLAALVREAALEALRRATAGVHTSERLSLHEQTRGLQVTGEDFRAARRRVQPSALRELIIQTPAVRWDDIGGLEDVKRILRDGIELPLTAPASFQRLGIRAAKGFLLFGPPGTGKTLLAKAVAHESSAHFLAVKSTDLLSKWFGESERQLARLFARAREVAPAVIFFDEIDALAPQRGHLGEPAASDRVVNTLLAEMDGLQELHGVVVIAATNRPTLLDPALLRPGRLDELIYVPIPDRAGRKHILRALTTAMPLHDDVDLDILSDRTEGFTGADLEGLVRRAGLRALRLDADAVQTRMRDFEVALHESHASVTPDIQHEYELLRLELKRESARGARRIGFVQP